MTRPMVYVYEYDAENRDEYQTISQYADEIADALLLAITNAEEIRLLDRTEPGSVVKTAFEITVGVGGDIPHRVAPGVIWKFLRIREAEAELAKAKKALEYLKK